MVGGIVLRGVCIGICVCILFWVIWVGMFSWVVVVVVIRELVLGICLVCVVVRVVGVFGVV